MVNINIEVDDEIHKEMKLKCVTNSITIQEHINKLIKEDLHHKRKG